MIRFHTYTLKSDRQSFLENFDPSNTTWVVTDLHSKLEIQKNLFTRGTSVLAENSVLRANELWLLIQARIEPEFSTVSTHLMTAIIQDQMEKMDLNWISEQSASKIVKLLDQFLPIVGSDDNTLLVLEWLRENEKAALKWGAWFGLCHQIWQELKTKKLICPNWVSSLISAKSELSGCWKRNLVIDLGVDLSLTESHILTKLSQEVEVDVLIPIPNWAKEYQNCYVGYSVFTDSDIISQVQASSVEPKIPSVTLKKFTTMISEVKDAVSTVRKWIAELNVDLDKIAIIAPDMEVYWPSLNSHLKAEQIPAQKKVVSQLQCFPEIVNWLSLMRIAEGQANSGLIEGALYSQKSTSCNTYEKFKSQAALIAEPQETERISDLEEIILKENKSRSYLRNEFLIWMHSFWKWKSVDLIELINQKILSECPREQSLDLCSWITYVESLCAQTEYDLGGSIAAGIHCLNLQNTDWLDVTHVYVLGLVESSLSSSVGLEISTSEVSKLSSDLGFNLSTEGQNTLGFKAFWLLQNPLHEMIVSVPATNFSGAVEEPALIWLRTVVGRGEDPEKLNTPGETVLDNLQVQFRQRFEQNSLDEKLSQSISIDLGKIKPEEFGTDVNFTLSASKLERYSKCPFLFTANYLFKLDDLKDLDLDMDMMSQGRFMHKLFEEILEQPEWQILDKISLEGFVEKVKSTLEIELADNRTWEVVKKKYIDLALRFINFEKNWQKEYPSTENLGREVFISGFWNPETTDLEPSAGSDKSIKFNGVVARIDGDRLGNTLILDYKSSGNRAKNSASWRSSQLFQLALYVRGLNRGLTTNIKSKKVVSAVFYDAKKMVRDKGFGFKDFSGNLYDGSRTFLVTEEAYSKVENEIFDEIGRCVNDMLIGKFGPDPLEQVIQDECPSCKWRGLCRAPHLN